MKYDWNETFIVLVVCFCLTKTLTDRQKLIKGLGRNIEQQLTKVKN